MSRKILLITTDQMRHDALGCNGGTVARTPVIDALARNGINYKRAHNQNVVCMPARATIITGQYVATHGVWRTASRCRKKHPPSRTGCRNTATAPDCSGRRTSNRLGAPERSTKTAWHGSAKPGRTAASNGWNSRSTSICAIRTTTCGSEQNHPEAIAGFYPMLTPQGMQTTQGAGATGALQVADNPVPRELYHTDWVAERTIAWLDTLPADADWFVWMSFPDPHHPWVRRRRSVRTRALARARPPARPPAARTRRPSRSWPAEAAPLAGLVRGPLSTNMEGGPTRFVPCRHDARPGARDQRDDHVENELIDEACGRVLARIAGAAGTPTPTSSSPPTTASCRATSASLFKGPYHATPSCGSRSSGDPRRPRGRARRRRRPGRPARPRADVLPHRRRRRSPEWMEGGRCRL